MASVDRIGQVPRARKHAAGTWVIFLPRKSGQNLTPANTPLLLSILRSVSIDLWINAGVNDSYVGGV